MRFIDKLLEAGRCNRLDEIIKCRLEGHEWNSELTNLLATKGFYLCLKWSLENGCPIDQYTLGYCARHGNLMCLKLLTTYCLSNIGADYYFALVSAAEYGHIRCLEYLIDAIDTTEFKGERYKVCCYAIHNRHLDCAKLLIMKEYYFDTRVIMFWLNQYYEHINEEDVWWRIFIEKNITLEFENLLWLIKKWKKRVHAIVNVAKEVTTIPQDVCEYIVSSYL